MKLTQRKSLFVDVLLIIFIGICSGFIYNYTLDRYNGIVFGYMYNVFSLIDVINIVFMSFDHIVFPLLVSIIGYLLFWSYFDINQDKSFYVSCFCYIAIIYANILHYYYGITRLNKYYYRGCQFIENNNLTECGMEVLTKDIFTSVSINLFVTLIVVALRKLLVTTSKGEGNV